MMEYVNDQQALEMAAIKAALEAEGGYPMTDEEMEEWGERLFHAHGSHCIAVYHEWEKAGMTYAAYLNWMMESCGQPPFYASDDWRSAGCSYDPGLAAIFQDYGC